jgi:hypothetical protein
MVAKRVYIFNNSASDLEAKAMAVLSKETDLTGFMGCVILGLQR